MSRTPQDILEEENTKLRKELAWYKRLLEVFPDPIFIEDHDHRIAIGNAAFRTLADAPLDEIVGEPMSDVLPCANSTRRRDPTWSQEELSQNDEVTDESGALHFMSTRRIGFEMNNQRWIVGVMRDVTDLVTQRRAQDHALEEAQAHIDAILAHVPVAIVIFDEVGNPSMTAGRVMAESNERPAWWEGLVTRIKRQRTSCAWHIVTDDDRRYDVRYERMGAGSGSIAVVIDVTDQHRLEEHLRETDKIDTIGRLAAGIAHDFNNLIGVFMATAETGMDALADGAYDDVREDLLAVRDASVRAAELTHRLLTFARRSKPERVALDVHEHLEEMRTFLERLIGAGVALNLDLRASEAMVEMDRAHLQQVVMNLAVNAKQAMRGSGTISIDTEDRELAGSAAIAVRVIDDGPGMPPEVLERALEPLFTTRSDGTGLGLATCAGIVRESGGMLNIESEVGHGTMIEIVIPNTQKGAKRASITEVDVYEQASVRVLFVDDDRAVRRAIARSLERRGYDVMVADGPNAALPIIAQGLVDIVVTDIVMPKMSGVAFARQIDDRLPVILTSGYLEETVLRYDVSEDEFPMIAKPFAPADLDHLIQSVVRRTHAPIPGLRPASAPPLSTPAGGKCG